MKSFFLGCLIVMLITGCAKKKGENLLNIPITLEVYLTNHVKEVYYPSIEELSQNMVKLFYKTEPIERHTSFLKADFNGDNYPDYAFILPLKEKGKNKDSLFLIINSKKNTDKNQEITEDQYSFFYLGLNYIYKNDYLTLKEGSLIKNTEEGNVMTVTWDNKENKYIKQESLK